MVLFKTCMILLIASIIIISGTGCSAIPGLLEGTKTPASGAILLEDDFSDTPNGWGTMGREGGEIGFEYQGLTIKVNMPNYLFWTVNGPKFKDTRFEVDAVLLDGPANDNFGVICRYVNSSNFYGFLISHDGYYGIFKMSEGNMILAGEKTNLDFSDVIRQGGIVNHIEALCSGDTLKLTVNEIVLAEIRDSSFSEGQVGLIAGAYDTPGVQVLFDNLIVYQP
jgi:hypothetical protein